ncbi:hypothetical protein NQ314_001920 [Rhamnusium bicolor]|uniref:PHD-type domain-containing protein n=1 Tax=Rhamnusium bicolor TaxID=1586634 RepID=A0AAV8ZR70_9CUCU|nr:hypothetical protein NQ314_001920 [Rhamnusium bicolor]
MPRNRSRGLRVQWTKEVMTRAIEAVAAGMSVNKASITYALPRRTLRRCLKENKRNKAAMGRKPILTKEQVLELKEKQMARRYWLNGFMQSNPQIRPRKAQNLNPARAQKLNKFIVNDHFTKLEEIMGAMNIIDNPKRIYNIDEKGCRLCLHHQQKLLARKGARRVHLVANVHSQNVSIVACGNAIGTAIPPMILFKGKRMKPEWGDSMPPGPLLLITEKGISRQAFSKQNAFWRNLATVWDKTMTRSNIKARFRATGIYPLNREAIPEVTFAPSSITNQDQGHEPEQQQRNNVMPSTSREEISSPAGPSTSGLQKKQRAANSGDSRSDSDSHFSLHDESSDDPNSEEETAQDATSDHNISFTDMLITPDKAVTNTKRLRKPAINSRAQVITIDLFRCEDKNKATSKANINKRAATSKTATPKIKIMKESWFCKLCREDRPADMRLCSRCLNYVHEECVELTKKDKIPMFLCPNCE